MEKRWTIKYNNNNEAISKLTKELNVSKCIANLLFQRGVTNYDEAKQFFRPELSQLHNPFLMKDMDKAIDRIQQAIAQKQNILVYGDYDVDGTSAVALVYSFFKKIYPQLLFYIPDRYLEGYGISNEGIDFASENNISLIIALDCGIKAIEKAKYARSKNIDLIICDHHLPGETIPSAYAVLDPKQPGCNYPYKELSGCGIGFKLIQAYAQRSGINISQLNQYLDLVAISIASDIVQITGENRILAYYGLQLINTNPRPGIEAVLECGQIFRKSSLEAQKSGFIFSRQLNINDLVFLVGPRINAAGRIESGLNSVKLLISETPEEAKNFASQIDLYNTERRNLDTSTTQQAIEIIQGNKVLMNKKSTVIYHPEWHKGVIGIVASRLTETFYRPTIVFTNANANDIVCGSARSVKDFDIYEVIDDCSDLLEHFGGHKYAAGLSLKKENLETFIDRFENLVKDKITHEMQVPEIEIDDEISLSQITPNFFKIIKQFAPFGPGNMAPIFLSKGVVDIGTVRLVGKNDKNHLKLCLTYPEESIGPFSAIGFQLGEYFDKVQSGSAFDICYHIEENEWNGNVSLQLNIKDIKINS